MTDTIRIYDLETAIEIIGNLRTERDAALALAERRAGERDRLRDWLNIAKKFVWDEEIVENIDAELAAPTPASEGDGEAGT